ncbi:hypothetical protein Droror1_Dr00013711 [Drosera rotundifolia]
MGLVRVHESRVIRERADQSEKGSMRGGLRARVDTWARFAEVRVVGSLSLMRHLGFQNLCASPPLLLGSVQFAPAPMLCLWQATLVSRVKFENARNIVNFRSEELILYFGRL